MQFQANIAQAGAAGQRSMGSLGYSLLMVGQTVDDVQYGFKSIVNNIPQLVMAVGGSAGLAGAAVIAGVAFNQFGGSIAKALDWTQKNRSEITKTSDAIKAMRDGSVAQTVAMIAQSRDEKNRESGASFLASMGGGHDLAGTSLGSKMAEIAREFNDPRLEEKIRGQFLGQAMGQDKQLRDLKNWNKGTTLGFMFGDSHVDFRQQEITKDVEARISRVMSEVEKGSVEGVKAGIAMLRDAGQFDIADELEKGLSDWFKETNRSLETIYLGEYRKFTAEEQRHVDRLEATAASIVGTMKHHGNTTERRAAESAMMDAGIPQARINQLLDQRAAELERAHRSRVADLEGQGYTRAEIEARLDRENRTDRERAQEREAEQRRKEGQDLRDMVRGQATEIARKVMSPDGSFSDDAQKAVLAVSMDTAQAQSVMTDLRQEEEKRIKLLQEEWKAQGASNDQIKERLRLLGMGEEEKDRQKRNLAKTGFTTEGIAGDIIALTRSRAEGGAGMSRDQAESFAQDRLTRLMRLQGFSADESGKMAQALISSGKSMVSEALEDLARTMPRNVTEMQAILREQMAIVDSLQRDGIKMVLGRRGN